MASHGCYRFSHRQGAHSDPKPVYWRVREDGADTVRRHATAVASITLAYDSTLRFGDTLPQVDNILHVTPFETTPRRVHNIEDLASYKKLHATLPAAVLASFKARVRAGDPKAIQDLWNAKDKNFMALDFEWSERNPNSALEWGYAAARCGHLAE
jgi:hypothetical protein